jgi:hypothetical protein
LNKNKFLEAIAFACLMFWLLCIRTNHPLLATGFSIATMVAMLVLFSALGLGYLIVGLITFSIYAVDKYLL